MAFKPPRWGGEVELRVQMPDCFGKDCPAKEPEGDAGKVPSKTNKPTQPKKK
jgi:hypothetical protein